MPSTKVAQVSFAGGEISTDMYGRQDDTKYQNGLKRCLNCVALPQGPVRNRPGFACVAETKYPNRKVRIIPFTFNAEQTCIIELGHKYARFYTDGGAIMKDDGSAEYEITTPWSEDDLFTLHYTQAGDIITVVSSQCAPQEIRRYGWTDWRIVPVSFEAALPTPTGVKAEKASSTKDDPNANNYTFQYKVSCLNADKSRESEASSAVSVVANLYSTGTTVKISCGAVSGASFYRFYKNVGGLYGYIGDSETPEIIDDNIAAKTDITPRRFDKIFNTAKGIQSVTVSNGGAGYGSRKIVSDIRRKGYVRMKETYRGEVQSDRVFNDVSLPLDVRWDFPNNCEAVQAIQGGGTGASGRLELETVGSGEDAYKRLKSVRLVSTGSGYSQDARFYYKGEYVINSGVYRRYVRELEVSFPCETIDMVPRVYVTDSTGSGAELQAEVENGKIVAIRVIKPGQNYTAPVVHIDGSQSGGGGAVATANVGTAGSYPSAVAYFEQRKIFGGLASDPQRVVMTRSGTESDLTYSLPTKDDDRVSFQIASREYNVIEHIVPLSHLIVLTSGSEMRISPMNSDAITPSSVSARPQSYNGASSVQPVLVNNSCVYAAARGGHVLDFSYRYDAGGYISNDLSIRSTHLFDFKTIVDLAQSKSPYPVVWAVSSDGSLLGCTYIPDQNLESWHQHTTAGSFESVACASEGTEDHVYVVVKRSINGVTKRFIERMESFNFGMLERAFFVDCGGTYEGEPTTTVSIPWLDGETVSILADGAVMPQQKVTGGRITLPVPARIVHVGLPYNADVQTLPVTLDQPGGGNGIKKNVYRASLKVYRSSGLSVGPSFTQLVEHKQRTLEDPGSAPALFSGDVMLHMTPSWSSSGEFCIRQSDPLPIHLLSLVASLSV